MGRKTLKLGRPDLGAQIEQRYRREKDARLKTRLLCMKIAATGEHTGQEIADLCGVSRASVFEWVRAFRDKGFAALMERGRPGPRGGEMRGIAAEVKAELGRGVEGGRWATAEAARQWLEREHGIKRPYVTVWQWLKKIGRGAAGAAAQTPRRKSPGGRGVQKGTGRAAGRPRPAHR